MKEASIKTRFLPFASVLLCLLYLLHAGPELVSARSPLLNDLLARHTAPATAPSTPILRDNCAFVGAVLMGWGAGTISGVVRDAVTEEPIAGVNILACGHGYGNSQQYGHESFGMGTAVTDDDGRFTIRDLPTETNQGPLSYAVIASALDSSHPKDEIRPLTNLVVTETTELEIVLRPGGTVKGIVTDEHSATPLPDVKVYAHFEAPPATRHSEWLWRSATADASGQYTLTNLSTYDYALFFESPDEVHVWEEYPDTPNYLKNFMHVRSRHRVPVTAGMATNGIDATLRRYAEVSGRVTISVTGQPLSDTVVSLAFNNPDNYPIEPLRSVTDEEGYYTALVPSGSYGVLFKPPASSGYPCQLYYDPSRPDEYPLQVEIEQPEAVTMNAALREPGKITGRVRYASGRGIPTALIYASLLPDPECESFGSAYTVNPDGTFELSNLMPRTYRLAAELRHLPVYLTQRQSIRVPEGGVVSGVEFVFPEPVYLPLLWWP